MSTSQKVTIVVCLIATGVALAVIGLCYGISLAL